MDTERSRFEAIYAKEWQTVWRAARRIVSCDLDADEVAQRVFVGLWCRGPEAWQRPLRTAFFQRAGRNEALAFLKQQQHVEALGRRLLQDLPTSMARPDEAVERGDLIDRIRSSIARLPPRCRSVIDLALAGMTHAEIAEHLGVTTKAVEKQITRAHRLLRSMPAIRRLASARELKSSKKDGGERAV